MAFPFRESAYDEYERHLTAAYIRTTADGVLQSRDEALAIWRASHPASAIRAKALKPRAARRALPSAPRAPARRRW
mgnify:CR=1 FL=1